MIYSFFIWPNITPSKTAKKVDNAFTHWGLIKRNSYFYLLNVDYNLKDGSLKVSIDCEPNNISKYKEIRYDDNFIFRDYMKQLFDSRYAKVAYGLYGLPLGNEPLKGVDINEIDKFIMDRVEIPF